ncbi:precorrin-6A/cobalt-precorrin-6A reductase [Rhizobium sp. SG_E_25_P2]|uniref:cobalt-precorrin-6A reductase n=1 Tax=Rhizobium sp. SG_E_25_P2 TaxID=2879942 RepID=UPI002475AA87|nr:cobalt-precorrin-6A reductase [Rhizobium sp. SG_E_25_P2]MDH6268595.1 precorrin-6A/cobalt-precorrin-6A reductase [Rhizobium sp. SG_E_25_P2]
MAASKILILGGTTEARKLAEALAPRKDLDVTVSLAGRTQEPRPLPVKTRHGGFGGVEGLAAYLKAEDIALLVDATHPFAQRMTPNAIAAAELTSTPLLCLNRPGWVAEPGDDWRMVTSIEDAVEKLGAASRRVFLAIGRQEAHLFSRAPQHFYLARSVDPIDPPIKAPDCRYILATGPFSLDDEIRLLTEHAIDVVVSKNSGGAATYAKIEAARRLGLAVVMVERKRVDGAACVDTVEGALAFIDHALAPAK